MDMNNFRPELHIAQQSRRDKLRIQNDLGVFVNNLEQIPGNICYDPSEFCSEMLHFPAEEPDKRAVIGEGSYPNCAVSSDPQYFSGWRSVASQSSSEWMHNNNHGPIFVGDGLSGSSVKIMSSSNPISSLDAKPYLGFQELHSSGEISHTKQFVDMNCNSSLYHSALQELVRQKSSEGSSNHVPWAVDGSELLLLPAYADQLGLKGPADLMSRPAQECNQWSELDSSRDLRTVANDNSNTQALSLSLSSVPSPKVHECQIGGKDFRIRDNCHGANFQDSRTWKPECLTPNANLSRGVGAQALTHRNPGPLGPFTGYATILRSSKFLRPAQQLLDEICCIARPKNVEICEVSDRIFDEVRVSSEGVSNGDQSGLRAIAGESGLSSFPFNGSYDKSREPGGTSCLTDSHRPENLHKKAKLLYMQDEVCKRYKQYHQQMQMVVSSFESVAGLSAATPYVSLALKMIAKHFRCLKNAITDQLKSIKNALGEELPSPSGGTSSSKGGEAAVSVSMLKFFDQNFQKQKGAGGLGILEGQHIWRPQRGLPERAVSVLRAWLFDHFLHPYPTDTDKHMLAAQTGLTRNQVSNWFINARVRVWKPMVEEIHMLETKGTTETGSEATGKTPVENHDQPNESNQSLNRLRISAQVECSSINPSENIPGRPNPSMWNQEKRSRIEYHIPSSVDGSLMGFMPSHRSGVEMGGLGSVSLTLGLRQSAENAQRQPEHHFRPHFGGQIIRDFVG